MRRAFPLACVNNGSPALAGFAIGFASLLSATGCGNGLTSVSGTVTLDGDPIRATNDVRATVYFNPADGGVAAYGLVDEDGRYEMYTGREEGVAPGRYDVTFNATQLVPPKEPGGTPSGRRISPPRYTTPASSGLSYTIEPQGATIDLALTSDGA